MIDIHCHILPGLDDGSPSIEQSLQMARMAVQDGISTIVATPHHANGKYDNEAHKIHTSAASLSAVLKKNNIPLQILSGQELRVTSELISNLEAGAVLTLNESRYLLIEFPSHGIPSYTKEIIHELQVAQITPVIAHPERNKEMAETPAKLYELIELGALCQLTSHSITGLFGPTIRKHSLEMCRRNWIHFVASDAHNATNRPFALKEAYNQIDKEIGSMYSSYYLANAQALIENKVIPIHSEPIPVKKKWYQLWS
ncbi:tyrosine-protein phosphatase [Paenibacillus sp. J2TS4]|uniref:tyrosine-protein phosphatase n=1 Tax=Paenibacillus sp. J2TS4 TaxID=2807194 RepID=UPI001B10B61C|nr:CpsB/CapC family capsule biosynthesis tyrosine phosphatase [Paenibacillus sp. J2TS4]GIP35128.1 tyrosine protein phosphatase [Paenibacillus sp. J2TS4]